MPQEELHFGEGEPFTIGVEEELFLVDPGDGHLVNTGPDVIEQIGELRSGEIKNELHKSQIELITGVCTTAREAVAELCELRRAVLATGTGVVACATHPTAVEGDSQFTEKRRYERIHEILGDAGATPVCALHIHVGMPDADTAVRVFNGLRRHLPLLEALGANAPYRHGRDTGLASARELTLRSWPRSGVPRAMADIDDFLRSTALLTQVAEVADYTFHWWKLRPHPRLGTVELRALDTQLSPRHTAALAAAVQSLAHYEALRRAGRGPAPRDPRRGLLPRGTGGRRGDAARRAVSPASGRRPAGGDDRDGSRVRARAALRCAARRPVGAARRRRRRRHPAPRLPRRRAWHRRRARGARQSRRADRRGPRRGQAQRCSVISKRSIRTDDNVRAPG